MLHTQQEMLGRVLEFLPAEVQQQFGVTPTRPSVFPTQVSSNNLGEQQLPMVDEVTRSFIFFLNFVTFLHYLCVTWCSNFVLEPYPVCTPHRYG